MKVIDFIRKGSEDCGKNQRNDQIGGHIGKVPTEDQKGDNSSEEVKKKALHFDKIKGGKASSNILV